MAKAVALAIGPGESPPRRLKAKSKTSQATMFASASLGTQKNRFRRPGSIQDLKLAIWMPPRETVRSEVLQQCLGKQKEDSILGATRIPKSSDIYEYPQVKEWDSTGSEISRSYIRIALPWSEGEFFKQAKSSAHPISIEARVNDNTEIAISKICPFARDENGVKSFVERGNIPILSSDPRCILVRVCNKTIDLYVCSARAPFLQSTTDHKKWWEVFNSQVKNVC